MNMCGALFISFQFQSFCFHIIFLRFCTIIFGAYRIFLFVFFSFDAKRELDQNYERQVSEKGKEHKTHKTPNQEERQK